MPDDDCWAVIPVFDEAPTIREVASRALRELPRVIVVDDGSCDGTAEALVGLPVVLLKNRRNRGKAMSLWRGFRYALARGAGGVVTLDGDGQHVPEDITRLLAAARRMPGQLLVGARSRHARRSAPLRSRARYYANRFADFWISWAAGYPIVDSQSGLRFYPRELLDKVKVRHGKTRSFVFESEILIEGARLGFEARPVPVGAYPRRGPRPSHFRPLVDIARITRMVAGRLLARRLYLSGLYRSLRRPVRLMDEPNHTLDPASAAQSHPRIE